MTTVQQIQREITALPDDALREILDFVLFLKTKEHAQNWESVTQESNDTSQEMIRLLTPTSTSKKERLADDPFIGMWRDRKDLEDSTMYVRKLREQEWAVR